MACMKFEKTSIVYWISMGAGLQSLTNTITYLIKFIKKVFCKILS